MHKPHPSEQVHPPNGINLEQAVWSGLERTEGAPRGWLNLYNFKGGAMKIPS